MDFTVDSVFKHDDIVAFVRIRAMVRGSLVVEEIMDIPKKRKKIEEMVVTI